MQVIPENLNITSGYHILETPEDVIINSQLYEKFTMEPKHYKFFNTNMCYPNKNLLLHQCTLVNCEYNIFKEWNYDWYIQDSNDTNTFYFLTEQSNATKNQALLIVSKNNNGDYVVKKSVTVTTEYLTWAKSSDTYILAISSIFNAKTSGGSFNSEVTYNSIFKMMCQTDEHIILVRHLMYDTSNGSNGNYNEKQYNCACPSLDYLISINKKDYSVQSNLLYSETSYDSGYFFITEHDNNVFLLGNTSGQLRVIVYNPLTNKMTVAWTLNDNQGNVGISNIIKFNDRYCVLSGTKTEFKLLSLGINLNTFAVDVKTYDIPTNTDFPFRRFSCDSGTSNEYGYDCHWLKITLNNIGNKYLNITLHDNTNTVHGYKITRHRAGRDYLNNIGQTYLSSKNYHKHAIYKYNSDTDTFNFTDYIQMQDKPHIYGLMYYDDYTIMLFLSTGILGYKFDNKTEKFEQVFEKSGSFNTIGLDESNKFYIIDKSNKCLIYNNVISNTLLAEFELSSYVYNKQDISTYIKVSSKNFIGDYISSKVQLTLNGSCVFSQNNRKTLTVNTLTSGEMTIPVTVTNGGTMYCYVKEVE